MTLHLRKVDERQVKYFSGDRSVGFCFSFPDGVPVVQYLCLFSTVISKRSMVTDKKTASSVQGILR